MRVATDAAIEMLSPDGRYMVLGASSRNSVEVIDLVAAKSVFSLNLGSSPYAIPIVDAGAQHIYLIGSAITKISVHGDSTQLLRKNPMSCDGLALGGPNSAGGLPFRILADGHTLVAFCPSNGHVSWFDLDRMTLTGDVAVGQNNPFWLSPVFSKDASTLYLHEGGTGTIHVVDLVHRKIVRSTTVARADRNPLAWLGSMLVTPAYAGGIPRTAAISPDANWLYAVGAFGAPGGVSLIHIPDLKISGRWLAANEYDALWVSADGRTLFLMDQNASRVTVVRTDGSPVAMVAVPSNLNTFLIPTTP
jgi:DNA-binding beta-propeller fold protein YncE